MDITQYPFGQEEIEQLRDYRDQQRDGRLKIRFVGLLMLAEGIVVEQAASLIGKSVKTLMRWGKQSRPKGIEALNSFQYQSKQTYLRPGQIQQVVAWVKETHPAKVKQVSAYLTTQFRLTYTIEAVRQVLHKQGLKRLRPKEQPGNPPDEAAQRAWVANYIQMKAECAPGTGVLFLDAMHLVHQNEPGYCWGDPKHPPVIKTNSGRKRLNLLGGYHPEDCSLVHVTGEAACNGERVVELLELVARQYATAPEIMLFSDNAPYFYATRVQEWLETHPTIWLLPLPAYAPNLNLIERLWKFVKEHVVKNTYYEQYKTFRAHVFRLLNHVNTYMEELKTLMVEKFQIIQPTIASFSVYDVAL
jgi:transposase